MNKPNFTAQEIRDAYPNPRAFKNADTTGKCYCVGGAFAAYVYNIDLNEANEATRFPTESIIRLAAHKANPSLHGNLCEALVCDLVTANDEGNFERAWQCVQELLKIRKY